MLRTGRRQRMSILLEIRDYIQKFYQKYAAVLNVILRFLAAFITFFATNRVIGFNPYLDHTYTELVFAAVSVVFPAQILLFHIILHLSQLYFLQSCILCM